MFTRIETPPAARPRADRSIRALLGGSAVALMCAPCAGAAAQDEPLETLASVHAACRSADEDGVHDRLFSLVLDGAAAPVPTEGPEEGETLYSITDARSLRAMSGAVQLVPAHLEPISFVANAERARSLEVARARGARVRVGFFLGFDEPERRACLVRAAQSVTAVRIDVAFVELIDTDGSVLAREDHDRLRAWNDDTDRNAAPEAQASVGAPTSSVGPLPEAWGRSLRAPALGRELLACHVAGVGRGAARQAMVQVRLRVDGRTGRVDDAVIEVGNVGDEQENACLVAALRGAQLPSLPGATASIDVRVPVQLRAP